MQGPPTLPSAALHTHPDVACGRSGHGALGLGLGGGAAALLGEAAPAAGGALGVGQLPHRRLHAGLELHSGCQQPSHPVVEGVARLVVAPFALQRGGPSRLVWCAHVGASAMDGGATTMAMHPRAHARQATLRSQAIMLVHTPHTNDWCTPLAATREVRGRVTAALTRAVLELPSASESC